MRPHFLAFVRAAHGKVRASVRWKTGRRHSIRCVALTFLLIEGFEFSFSLLNPQERSSEGDWKITSEEALGDPSPYIWDLCDSTLVRRAMPKRFRRRIASERLKRIRHERRIVWQEKTKKNRFRRSGYRPDLLEAIDRRLGDAIDSVNAHRLPDIEAIRTIAEDHAYENGHPYSLLRAAITLRPSNAGTPAPVYRALWRLLRREIFRASLCDVMALRALEAAAYRAHVTQRVRPSARRVRLPRPLYAQPRPPAAPLAPPVTC